MDRNIYGTSIQSYIGDSTSWRVVEEAFYKQCSELDTNEAGYK